MRTEELAVAVYDVVRDYIHELGYRASFQHYRTREYHNGTTVERYTRSGPERSNWTPLPNGGRTHCWLYDDEEYLVHAGTAHCSERDPFDYSVGRAVSLCRATFGIEWEAVAEGVLALLEIERALREISEDLLLAPLHVTDPDEVAILDLGSEERGNTFGPPFKLLMDPEETPFNAATGSEYGHVGAMHDFEEGAS